MPSWCECERRMVEPSMCGGCHLANDEITDDELEASEAQMNCGMMDDGQCTSAGSEYCDFECPYRDRP